MQRLVLLLAILTTSRLVLVEAALGQEPGFFQYVSNPYQGQGLMPYPDPYNCEVCSDPCMSDAQCPNCELCPVCRPNQHGDYQLRSDLVFLRREDPNGTALLFNRPGGPTFSTSQLEWDSPLALSVSAIRNCGCIGLELSYLGADDWESERAIATGPVVSPAGIFPMPFVILDGFALINYSSRMHSADINARYRFDERWAFLFGIRWLQLEERLGMVIRDNTGALLANYHQETSNNLLGFHMGSEWTVISKNRFAVGGQFKAGVFQNWSDHQAAVGDDMGPVGLPIDEEREIAAFVGELRLSMDYQINDMLMLRTGYMFLWLANVTLAGDQPGMSNFALGAGTDFEGNALMHGMTVGLEAWW